ncbi:putative stereocilin-like protein [Dissostichus eleginoides]|uniref:Stereocilin-like protein n=1 Tax=Dissostichus eleginoides TaxID=100907 RepID=A0AAD9F3V5_DISEL|nr:putative stereocilin-like protein [Dissostichus eleginoides]
MCATLTRNDERCSDRSPRPRSFFSGRMPSFPPSVKKKNLLCGFGVVEATFRSLMSPISSGLWRLAACLFSSLLKFHSRYKIGSAVLGFFDHGSVSDDGDYWLIRVCPLPADAATPPCHRGVCGKQSPLLPQRGEAERPGDSGPTAALSGGNAAFKQK